MRRLALIAAFGLFLAVPLWAQHGGGHSGGGHGGGFSGHSFSGGHASGGMHSSPGMSHSFSGAHSFSGTHSGSSFRGRGPIISNFGFNRGLGFNRNRRWGFGRWGWGYGGYYDPYWWWDSGSRFDQDYERDLDRADRMNEQSLEEQRMLRQEEADGDQDAYAHSSQRSASNRDEAKGVPIMPATILIYRDQHKQEIQNYAIVGQTLWNFSSQRTEKISLADLDLQATTKANEDQGVTFRIPVSNEAQ